MTARINPVDAVNGAPTYVARAWRQTAVAPFVAGATSGRPLGGRSGVRPGGAPVVSVTSSTVISVGAFAGIIDAETANEAGPYGFSFDAATPVTIQAANASNPRVDLISVQVSDPAESDGSTTPGVALVYTPGTAAATPNQPPTPAYSVPLVRVNVPASGGGNPTATFIGPYMTGAGGVLPVDTYANLKAFTGWPGAHAVVFGDQFAANNISYRWNGTTWGIGTPNRVTLTYANNTPRPTPTTSGTIQWVPWGNIAVPAGARRAIITYHAVGVQAPSSANSTSAQIQIGSVLGASVRMPGSGSNSQQSWSWVDDIDISALVAGGSFGLQLNATYNAGSGSYTTSADTRFAVTVELR